MRTQIAILVGALIASNVSVSQVRAESPVTIQSSGPERFAATTGKPTGQVMAIFEIADASLTATGALICRILPEGTKRGCRYQRFDLVKLDDEDWDYIEPVRQRVGPRSVIAFSTDFSGSWST